MNKNTIYVVTHKQFNIKYDKELYKIIQVGNKFSDKELKDNIGDNISEKNKNYCELTALYWIWKNDKISNVVGITHYRRFFAKNFLNKLLKKPVTEKYIKRVLKKYDILIPEPMIILDKNVIEQYSDEHFEKDLNICGDIISEKYPEYQNSFYDIMKRRYYSQFNMLICQKQIYDKYMEWLFDILFEAEKRIDISNYDSYNQRIFGFLSERLFNVWLQNNKQFKIKELPVYNSENKDKFVRRIARHIKYKLKIKKLKNT